MLKYLEELIQNIFDPAVGPAALVTIIALGAMIVAAMSIYAAIEAIKVLKKKR